MYSTAPAPADWVIVLRGWVNTELIFSLCPRYGILLDPMERLHFWGVGECGAPHSLPLLPGPLCLSVAVLLQLN